MCSSRKNVYLFLKIVSFLSRAQLGASTYRAANSASSRLSSNSTTRGDRRNSLSNKRTYERKLVMYQRFIFCQYENSSSRLEKTGGTIGALGTTNSACIKSPSGTRNGAGATGAGADVVAATSGSLVANSASSSRSQPSLIKYSFCLRKNSCL